MKSYPIWKYHKEQLPEGKIFYSHEAFEAAGSGWVDSPSGLEKEVVFVESDESSDEVVVDVKEKAPKVKKPSKK